MLRLLLILIFVLSVNLHTNPVNAEIIGSKSFMVEIPKAIKIESVGVSPKSQQSGLPVNQPVDFSLLVKDSYNSQFWELTTNNPIGVSVSYNSSGTIIAVFVSMKRASDGYAIPESDIKVTPSKAVFDVGPKGGEIQKIFHFNPIIRVSKNTPPGNYVGTIEFSIMGR